MSEDGLPLALVLALLRGKARGRSPDLASLALVLALYDTAIHQGLLDPAQTERSVPLALKLVKALQWGTPERCLTRGHCQAGQVGFFKRLPAQPRLRGNARHWRARSLDVAWRDFQRDYVAWPLDAGAEHLYIPPQTRVRGVSDFRTLVLRSLFETQASLDPALGVVTWQIGQRALAEILGISKRSVPTYLERAGIVSLIAGEPYAPLTENYYVLPEAALAATPLQST